MAVTFQKDIILKIKIAQADGAIQIIEREAKAQDDANSFINENQAKDITTDITGQTLTDLQTGVTGVFDAIKTDLGVT